MEGQSGATLDEVLVPWNGLNWGPYGGAVNQDGDFWVSGWQLGPLVRIDEDGVNYEVFQVPQNQSQWTYGMALDEFGRPWVATQDGAMMFDPNNSQWQFFQLGAFSTRGMGADRDGRVWAVLNSNCGLGVIDYNTKQVVAPILNIPGCIQPVGVSVDAEGFVWVVDQSASTAFKINGDTFQVVGQVGGLNQPYTYSDMTGSGLGIVTNPPQG
jgi:streptogramin lyase